MPERSQRPVFRAFPPLGFRVPVAESPAVWGALFSDLREVGVRRVFVVLMVVMGLGASAAPAVAKGSDLARMRKFLTGLQSLQGQFVQHTLNAAVGEDREAAGEVWIERPDKVRWHFKAPSEQDVLINGGEMWVYSPELEQVVVRHLAPGDLERTPLAFLAGVAGLEDLYEMQELPSRGHEEEIQLLLTPKKAGGSFQSVSLRVLRDGLVLAGLEIVDQVGNLTSITFHGLRTNQPVDPAHFVLTVPPGTQRIEQPAMGSRQ
jgi:outer membrane lipoprotein carrier protein